MLVIFHPSTTLLCYLKTYLLNSVLSTAQLLQLVGRHAVGWLSTLLGAMSSSKSFNNAVNNISISIDIFKLPHTKNKLNFT